MGTLHNRKFTIDQVNDIRTSKASCRELGRLYGVSHVTISKIKKGEHYPHIPFDTTPYSQITKQNRELDNLELAAHTIRLLIENAPTRETKVWLLGELALMNEDVKTKYGVDL